MQVAVAKLLCFVKGHLLPLKLKGGGYLWSLLLWRAAHSPLGIRHTR